MTAYRHDPENPKQGAVLPPTVPIPLHLGVVGYGEAGSAFAEGLAGEPNTIVHVFDTTFDGRTTKAGRTASDVIIVEETLAGLAAACTVVLSCVAAAAAVPVAASLAPHIDQRHLVVELNSVSPATKLQIGELVIAAGAQFVEAAIMTNIAAKHHRTPLYVCGPGAEAFIAVTSKRRMDVESLGTELGRASATKMFRSILAKGLEALLLECLIASDRYGVSDRVLAKFQEGYPGLDWAALADNLLGRTAVHGRRRADEMFEVAATLEAMNINPHMAAGAAYRIRESGLAIEGVFTVAPASYQEVVAQINAHATPITEREHTDVR
jgi:3-hydroxyisobutyrate dehydrogenase-like beta-hydroxyacid dehydrogenase